MAYYISFLKTLSLKLNNHTVHFFYNEVRPETHGGNQRGLKESGDIQSEDILFNVASFYHAFSVADEEEG